MEIPRFYSVNVSPWQGGGRCRSCCPPPGRWSSRHSSRWEGLTRRLGPRPESWSWISGLHQYRPPRCREPGLWQTPAISKAGLIWNNYFFTSRAGPVPSICWGQNQAFCYYLKLFCLDWTTVRHKLKEISGIQTIMSWLERSAYQFLGMIRKNAITLKLRYWTDYNYIVFNINMNDCQNHSKAFMTHTLD